jgi:pentatricopeptide repeat protein
MYAECGCIAKAHGIFNKMEHRNLVSWNTMILFGNHGFRRKAMELLVKMKTTGVKPDFVTFVGLLTACNHAELVDAELVDEGRVYFQFYGRNLWDFSSNRGFF